MQINDRLFKLNKFNHERREDRRRVKMELDKEERRKKRSLFLELFCAVLSCLVLSYVVLSCLVLYVFYLFLCDWDGISFFLLLVTHTHT
jgi:hypothetical protein